MYDISTLKEKKISELQDIAKSLKIKKITSLKKQELIYQIIDFLSTNPETNPKSETLKEDSSSENDNKSTFKKSTDKIESSTEKKKFL